MTRRKPNAAQMHAHSTYAATDRQIRRLAEGRNESKPSDYWQPSAEQKKQARARALLEDRKLMKELGL